MSRLTFAEESALVERLKRGDDTAWEPLLDDNYPSLIGWIMRWGVVERDAEDVAQETIIVFRKKMPTYEHGKIGHGGKPARLFTFLVSIAHFKCFEWWKKNKNKIPESDLAHDGHNDDGGTQQLQERLQREACKTEEQGSTLTSVEKAAELEVIVQAINRLSNFHKTLLTLRYLSGSEGTLQDVSDHFEEPTPSWADRHIKQALKALKAELNKQNYSISQTEPTDCNKGDDDD